MTQEQLALALDVDPMTISRFERGVTLPSLPTLHKAANVFGVPLARLLDDAPAENHGEATALTALIGSLAPDEQDFLIDLIKRFCALRAHSKPKRRGRKVGVGRTATVTPRKR